MNNQIDMKDLNTIKFFDHPKFKNLKVYGIIDNPLFVFRDVVNLLDTDLTVLGEDCKFIPFIDIDGVNVDGKKEKQIALTKSGFLKILNNPIIENLLNNYEQ